MSASANPETPALSQLNNLRTIDSNIIAQAPKMRPYIQEMKEVLAPVLGLELTDISIKAKTKEEMDSVGECKAIEANAVVMLESIS